MVKVIQMWGVKYILLGVRLSSPKFIKINGLVQSPQEL